MRLTRSQVLAVVALSATGAHAQNLQTLTANLSASCQTAAASLLGTSFGACSNLFGLVGMAIATNNLTAAMTGWAAGACQQVCAAGAVSQAQDVIQQGCKSDIAAGTQTATLLLAAVQGYTPIRHGICSQAKSNSSWCAVDLVDDIQTANRRNFSLGDLLAIRNNLTELTAVPKIQLCSDCDKSLYNVVEKLLTDPKTNASFASTAKTTCGYAFVDGKDPVTVQFAGETAATSTSNSSSSGSSGSGSASGTAGSSGSKNGTVSKATSEQVVLRWMGLALLASLGGVLAL